MTVRTSAAAVPGRTSTANSTGTSVSRRIRTSPGAFSSASAAVAAAFPAASAFPAAPAAAIRAVREGSADMACVALENSVDGPVVQTFDALAGESTGR
ncbi:prephenate dehydratase domain-containing protein, partial [Corynebacterium bovis]|uniref:prephenate dehydratase domain-containing protein n=1 Tax=Corynebacterium bovis TaxID=36808 RepID=UPI002651DDED